MWKLLRQKLRYYLQYLPFTLNTFLIGAAIWLAYYFLFRHTPQPGKIDEEDQLNSFQPFILLMAKCALILVVLFIALSVMSTVSAWIYYLWLKRYRGANLQLQFSTETQKGKTNKVFMNALLEGPFRPLLGFVKGRLFYDDYKVTDKFSLLSDKRKSGNLLRYAIGGKSRLNLPDIKEYQIKGGLVFFEDMLHLFSLAVPENAVGNFYQPPILGALEEQQVSPKKTETTDIRIEQMRKVEGEHLSYKDFESGDDVRRIVWKVYAKNRELVVRIPERFEPYASHLYFYASFHTLAAATWTRSNYGKEMLNYYKNNIWTVYDTLAEKDFEMRFIPDQSVIVPEDISEKDRVGRIISSSDWQRDKSLDAYFDARQGTVLCISSFTDVRELSQILEICDESSLIYFVQLSKTFRQYIALGWLKQLIFLPSKDRLSQLRDRWTFQPMRLQIHRKEKEILAILNKSRASVQIL